MIACPGVVNPATGAEIINAVEADPIRPSSRTA